MRVDDLWQEEFYDILKVLRFGEGKHGKSNWLEKDGKKSSHKDMCDSAFHHLAEAYSGSTADKETGIDPFLHAASRLLMAYTRRQRGLIHKDDKNEDSNCNCSGASNCS